MNPRPIRNMVGDALTTLEHQQRRAANTLTMIP